MCLNVARTQWEDPEVQHVTVILDAIKTRNGGYRLGCFLRARPPVLGALPRHPYPGTATRSAFSSLPWKGSEWRGPHVRTHTQDARTGDDRHVTFVRECPTQRRALASTKHEPRTCRETRPSSGDLSSGPRCESHGQKYRRSFAPRWAERPG